MNFSLEAEQQTRNKFFSINFEELWLGASLAVNTRHKSTEITAENHNFSRAIMAQIMKNRILIISLVGFLTLRFISLSRGWTSATLNQKIIDEELDLCPDSNDLRESVEEAEAQTFGDWIARTEEMRRKPTTNLESRGSRQAHAINILHIGSASF